MAHTDDDILHKSVLPIKRKTELKWRLKIRNVIKLATLKFKIKAWTFSKQITKIYTGFAWRQLTPA